MFPTTACNVQNLKLRLIIVNVPDQEAETEFVLLNVNKIPRLVPSFLALLQMYFLLFIVY